MTVSLLASARPLRSANIGLAGASIARRRATAGVIVLEPLSPELQELSDQQDRE